MNDNIFSNAWWWLRSRDTGALIFVAILAALLMFLLGFLFLRDNGSSSTGSEFDVSNPTEVAQPTAVPIATVPAVQVEAQPTIAVPTPIPTPEPTAALNSETLVDGADNADAVASETPAEATPEPTPAPTAAPVNTPVPAAPAPTATATPTTTPAGTPTPSPTPCIIGSGGFCIAPGIAPPATQATMTPTPDPDAASATATATAEPVGQASGSIIMAPCDSGSLTVTFTVTNPENGPETISALPVLPGPLQPAIVVPQGDTISTSVVLAPGYLVGQATLNVNAIPIQTVALSDCSSALG